MGIEELIVRNTRRAIGGIQRGHHVAFRVQEPKQRQLVAAVSGERIHIVVDEHVLRNRSCLRQRVFVVLRVRLIVYFFYG